MRKFLSVGVSTLAISMIGSAALADGQVYSNFPVTLKNYEGKKKTSVSYTGQIARHALHDSLKKLAGKGNGQPNPELKAKMMSYFAGKDKGRAIVAPATKGPFAVKQKGVDDISGGKNLAGKTYKGTITGMPNNMTGPDLLNFWIDKASSADKGYDLTNGYNYPQLISKFIMGAVFYNQAVDGYLDEYLSAEKKPNDKPYKKGAAYTGKEHAWDEAFGYFGAPAHTLSLTPSQVYQIAKQGSKSKDPKDALGFADFNKDGMVDLKSEMVFAPAYYAAGADKGGKTKYMHTITGAFLDGRKLLAAAKGEKLSDAQRGQLRGYASVIENNWEGTLAEATFKYAGSVYKDMVKLKGMKATDDGYTKTLKNYVKHWGELKGFSLALQTGKKNLGGTASTLNILVGFGPVMPDGQQVVNIDGGGKYVRAGGVTWGNYMKNMLKVQNLLVKDLSVKARANDMTKEMDALTKALGESESAEND